jgi:hypothetical protein
MDPEANLKEQRELAQALVDTAEDGMQDHGHSAVRLAELVLALDEWIKKGGFLPEDWKKP